MHEPLLAHIRKFTSLTTDEEKLLLSYCRFRTVKKKEHILHEGEVCQANYFVLKGCMRMYVITEKGAEQMIQFAIDNWWISDYNSFDRQTPSGFNIQAVEPSELAFFDKKSQDALFKAIPSIEAYFRVVYQRAYAASLMRIQYIYCLSAEERYLQFSRNFPEFVQRVPQYMIASYLGFTPEFLSKTRAKRSGG